jgi:Family of unknown function (DUF6804)
MLTKIMKWVSVTVLLLAALWRPSQGYQAMFEILICVSAILVVVQAVHTGKYFWAAGFASIAVLFNPIVPVALSHKAFLWLDVVCLLAFLLSLAALRRQTILSIPSITNRTPGSESL